MNIGKMNKRITIQKFTVIQNENGFDKEEWINHKTVWASVNNLSGKEFYTAKAVQAENTVEFTIRYGKYSENIDTKNYRIAWNGRFYNITFIDNIQYKNTFVKIKANEG